MMKSLKMSLMQSIAKANDQTVPRSQSQERFNAIMEYEEEDKAQGLEEKLLDAEDLEKSESLSEDDDENLLEDLETIRNSNDLEQHPMIDKDSQASSFKKMNTISRLKAPTQVKKFG